MKFWRKDSSTTSVAKSERMNFAYINATVCTHHNCVKLRNILSPHVTRNGWKNEKGVGMVICKVVWFCPYTMFSCFLGGFHVCRV